MGISLPGSEQLKQACKAGQAKWAAWLGWSGRAWIIAGATGLPQARANRLARLIEQGELSNWLSGALGNGRAPNRACSSSIDLACLRLYAFPNPAQARLLLVGADELTSEAQTWFKILAQQPEPRPGEPSSPGEPANPLSPRPALKSDDNELILRLLEQMFRLNDEVIAAQKACELLRSEFGCQAASILAGEARADFLTILGISGGPAAMMEAGAYIANAHFPGSKISARQGLLGRVFQSGRTESCPSGGCPPGEAPPGEAPPGELLPGELLPGESPPGELLPGELLPGESPPGASPQLFGIDSGSWACVVLKSDGVHTGVLYLQRAGALPFTPAELDSLTAVGRVMGMVLTNARESDALQRRVSLLQVARQTALDLVSDLELDSILRRIVQRAREITQASWAVLSLVDTSGEALHPVVGEPAWLVEKVPEIALGVGLIGQVASSGMPINLHDYQVWTGRHAHSAAMAFNAILGVPLLWKGQVIGVLAVMSDQPGRKFGEEDLEILELLAPKVAVSIRNARLYQEVLEHTAAEKQAEKKVLQAARLAAVGEMASGVAHELNNPLTTVIGFVELALEDLPDGLQQRADLALVLDEARRAKGVVRRLLDFARQSEAVRSLVAINSLIENVRDLIHHKLESQHIELEMNLAHDLPPVFVDPNQIKQVLINLCQNAIQAMPSGGTLGLTSTATRRAGETWLRVDVRDTGVGISPENQMRLFEPFFTTRPVGEGTGLGLSVSYGLVADHDGFMDFSSEVGQGSCFSILLPVREGQPYDR